MKKLSRLQKDRVRCDFVELRGYAAPGKRSETYQGFAKERYEHVSGYLLALTDTGLLTRAQYKALRDISFNYYLATLGSPGKAA